MLFFKVLFFCSGSSFALQPLPPIQWVNGDEKSQGYSLERSPKVIYLDNAFASIRDREGLTLIPPSAAEFAETFRQDLQDLFQNNWDLSLVDFDNLPAHGIILGRYEHNATDLAYEDGSTTEEGYKLQVTNGAVHILGTGARGMFWGTRTLLHELLLKNGTLAPGSFQDAPAYRTRGYMLDAGRKWYAPEFLKELCTYASFFKISEFHYHSSDNYPLNRGHNETWNKVFAHFSLYPEQNTALQDIVQRQNETLSRADFEDFQHHCAQRGITVIPEIEAPGHALAITKWKPELALAKKDLLNLSHPDAIPTVKSIWTEFLPWFQTKEVHIGADEYAPELADDYIKFVNEMSDFINATSGKRIRIWGTYEPSEDLAISKDIVVQHWQYGQSDPIQLQGDGYELINSEDWWAYMSLKNDHMPILPAPYPQFYNTSRTLNFANIPDWQWEPALYNPVNTTQQLQPGAQRNRGAILAAWNDNGPDATTQLEAYYAMREGIPVMAARAWAGSRGVQLDPSQLDASVKLLTSKAPGQNLDRRNLSSKASSSPWTWTRPANSHTNINATTNLSNGSFGPPYTLHLNISSPFTLSGPDTTLSLSPSPPNNTTITPDSNPYQLIFTTNDNLIYPLRSVSPLDGHSPTHPGRIWTNQSSTSSHSPVSIPLPARLRIETDVVNGTRVWINDQFAGRFEVFVFGGRNTLFSWSQMAFVAPLESVHGGVEGMSIEEGVRLREDQEGDGRGGGESIDGNGMMVGAGNKVGSLRGSKFTFCYCGVVAGMIAVHGFM